MCVGCRAANVSRMLNGLAVGRGPECAYELVRDAERLLFHLQQHFQPGTTSQSVDTSPRLDSPVLDSFELSLVDDIRRQLVEAADGGGPVTSRTGDNDGKQKEEPQQPQHVDSSRAQLAATAAPAAAAAAAAAKDSETFVVTDGNARDAVICTCVPPDDGDMTSPCALALLHRFRVFNDDYDMND